MVSVKCATHCNLSHVLLSRDSLPLYSFRSLRLMNRKAWFTDCMAWVMVCPVRWVLACAKNGCQFNTSSTISQRSSLPFAPGILAMQSLKSWRVPKGMVDIGINCHGFKTWIFIICLNQLMSSGHSSLVSLLKAELMTQNRWSTSLCVCPTR